MLVHADRQHPRIGVERGLHPIAVVRVDIHVGDALGAVSQQPGDCDRRVVVHAEPAGVRGHGMMHAARDAGPVLSRAGPDSAGRCQGRPGNQRRRLVHAGKDRVILGAQPEHPRDPELGPLQALAGIGVLSPAADRLHCRHVRRVMDKLQVRVGGRGWNGHGHPGLAPQPELVRKPHRQLHPHRCHRMARPEVIVGEPLVPGHMQAAGHLPQPLCRPGAPCRTHRTTVCCTRWQISRAWSNPPEPPARLPARPDPAYRPGLRLSLGVPNGRTDHPGPLTAGP